MTFKIIMVKFNKFLNFQYCKTLFLFLLLLEGKKVNDMIIFSGELWTHQW